MFSPIDRKLKSSADPVLKCISGRKVWCFTPIVPALGSLRQRIMSSRPSWATLQVPDKPELHIEILSLNKKKKKEK
jgi:hypothetical protein